MPQLRDITHYMEEFGDFESIQHKRSERPDIHALIILSEIVARDCLVGHYRGLDMICGAHEGELEIDINPSLTTTVETLIDLVRCGVVFSEEKIFYLL